MTYNPEERERLLLRAATTRTMEAVCRGMRISLSVRVSKETLLNTVASRVRAYMDSRFPGVHPDLMHDGEAREAHTTLSLLEGEVAWLEGEVAWMEGQLGPPVGTGRGRR